MRRSLTSPLNVALLPLKFGSVVDDDSVRVAASRLRDGRSRHEQGGTHEAERRDPPRRAKFDG